MGVLPIERPSAVILSVHMLRIKFPPNPWICDPEASAINKPIDSPSWVDVPLGTSTKTQQEPSSANPGVWRVQEYLIDSTGNSYTVNYNTNKLQTNQLYVGFQKLGVPPNHPFLDGILPYKSLQTIQLLRVPPWKPSNIIPPGASRWGALHPSKSCATSVSISVWLWIFPAAASCCSRKASARRRCWEKITGRYGQLWYWWVKWLIYLGLSYIYQNLPYHH